MSEQPYRVQGSRVYGEGQSYNCINIVTATELCQTLNQLTQNQTTSTETDKTLDMVQKKVIQLQMSVAIIAEELEALHKELIT